MKYIQRFNWHAIDDFYKTGHFVVQLLIKCNIVET